MRQLILLIDLSKIFVAIVRGHRIVASGVPPEVLEQLVVLCLDVAHVAFLGLHRGHYPSGEAESTA